MTAIAASSASAMPTSRTSIAAQSSDTSSDFATTQLAKLRKQRESVSGSKPDLQGNTLAIALASGLGAATGLAGAAGMTRVAEKSAWFAKIPAASHPEVKLLAIGVSAAIALGVGGALLGGTAASKLTGPNADETARRTAEHQQSVSQKLAVIDAQIRQLDDNS